MLIFFFSCIVHNTAWGEKKNYMVSLMEIFQDNVNQLIIYMLVYSSKEYVTTFYGQILAFQINAFCILTKFLSQHWQE